MNVGQFVFPLRLSFQVGLIATAAVAVIGIPFAYLLATRKFRGKALVDVLATLPLVLPPTVTGYYLLFVLGRNGLLGKVTGALTGTPIGMLFTWQAAVVASAVVALPFTIRTARAAIEGVDPGLIATSYTLGRSEWETAVFVTLPLAWRGLAAGLSLSFARALGEFGATIMVAGNIPGRTNTMPLEIYNAAIYGDWRTATVLVVVFTGISAAILLVVNRLTEAVAR